MDKRPLQKHSKLSKTTEKTKHPRIHVGYTCTVYLYMYICVTCTCTLHLCNKLNGWNVTHIIMAKNTMTRVMTYTLTQVLNYCFVFARLIRTFAVCLSAKLRTCSKSFV